jgi:DNA repair exonuclease SbcCD ATPase subunit
MFLMPTAEDDGSVSVAFSTTPEPFEDRSTTFELALDGGGAIRLPPPVKGRPRRADRHRSGDERPQRAARREAVGERRARAQRTADREKRETAEPKRRETARRAPAESPPPPPPPPARSEVKLTEELRSTVGRTEQLMQRIEGYEQSRASFEQELEAMRRQHAELLEETRKQHAAELEAVRNQADTTQRELSAAVEELRSANSQLERLHEARAVEFEEGADEDDAAKEREAELEQELESARAAADTAREAAEELLERLVERHGVVERARIEAQHAQAETSDVKEAVQRLRDEIARRAQSGVGVKERVRFAANPAVLDRYREELEQLGEQLPAIRHQATALRDAIYSELPYFLRASPDQQILPLPEEQPPPGHDAAEAARLPEAS